MASESVLATQITLGMIGAGVLRLLKRSAAVTWVNDNTGWVNHVILALTSAAGALSVNFVWNATAHSLTITGLDATAIALTAWLWAKQWTIQYLVHKGAFGAVSVPPAAPALPKA